MKNIVLTFWLIIMSATGVYSQDLSQKPPGNWIRFLHFESGLIFPTGSIKESLAIRQNISSYYVDQVSNGQISSETSGYNLGLRFEYFNTRLKAGISTGIRYTGYFSLISGFSSMNSDFFYLRYSMENSDTKFARVRSITETNNFICIPIEFRFVPVQIKGFGFFVKAGTEFSLFNMKKETNIKFQESSMEAYQDNILNSIGLSAKKLYSTLYGSIGIKTGQEKKPNYTFEVFLPSLILTKNNFTLTNLDYFQGFRFAVLFPLQKKIKL